MKRLQSKLQKTEDGEYVGHGDTVYQVSETRYPGRTERKIKKRTTRIIVSPYQPPKNPLHGCYSTTEKAEKGK